MKETANNAVTAEEKKIAVLLDRKNSYGRNSIWVKEALRVELTLRKKQTIIQKAKNYLGKEPTFENLFNEDFWFAMLKDEINEIYNHPLKNFIFLAMQNKPVIDAFLKRNFKSVKARDTAMGILNSLQEKGLKETRLAYLNEYSKQTWYNYIGRIKHLEKRFDPEQLKNITSIDILNRILTEFDIDPQKQQLALF